MPRTTKAKANIASSKKTEKPYPEFPLWAHEGSGQWCKKIKGDFHYFGVLADPPAALREYKARVNDIVAGVVSTPADGLTVQELANKFLGARKKQIKTKEFSERSWSDYHEICGYVLHELGKDTPISSLRPDDFMRFRAALAAKHGVHRLRKNVAVTRTLFKYAHEELGIVVPMGDRFKPPGVAKRRQDKAEKRKAGIRKFFQADQIRAALGKADQQMKAMILVGLNCGFTNVDIANMAPDSIQGEWLVQERTKTWMARRAWLWPETREALALLKGSTTHLFLQPNGKTWHEDLPADSNGKVGRDPVLSSAFNKLVPNRAKGASFATLRHVFQTIATRTGHKDTARAIMGHVPPSGDIAAEFYEEDHLHDGVYDDRIKAVCEAVRAWLYDGK